MRNLVVCCDGSWATIDSRQNGILCPTNVARIYYAADCCPETKYYHSGVGTEGGWWAKFRGGIVGNGLDKNIMSAYEWLAVNYQPEDKIFIFGFSRGAYTARSLAGMINICGLLDFSAIGNDVEEQWIRVEAVFKEGYRERKPRKQYPARSIRIHFLGVWDTVGALGVPDNYAVLSTFFNKASKYSFHNTMLGNNIDHARHAVALDEKRASFTPTLWTLPVPSGCDVKQVWFPGGHGDVGGGCLEKGLSDGALKWMMKEAADCGLQFKSDMMDKQVKPDPQDISHDALAGIFKMLRTQPRSCPPILLGGGFLLNDIHQSALDRQQNPPIVLGDYRPTKILGIGDIQEVVVYVREHWAETDIYLEKGGTYDFAAKGQWVLGGKTKCAPDNNKFFSLQRLSGSMFGGVENFFKRVFHNEKYDFLSTKRVEEIPWFDLTGVVANAHNPDPNGTPPSPEIFKIGREQRGYQPKESGYLYCFVNDAWGSYDAHQGSLTLTVKRI
jgi:hypothetical protein